MSQKTKGIILAGGKATRLYPITKTVCKQLLPVYNKPMIYYPLSTLMLAGIQDILIITAPDTQEAFKTLLGDGSRLGIQISYAIQDQPRGLADAFIIGEEFIGQSKTALVLGDNIFYGHGFQKNLMQATQEDGATVFLYYVNDPERYGIVEIDANMKVTSIEEKPKNPQSNWAVTGLYFYDHNVVNIAKQLKPSPRGELEITDVNKEYLRQGNLNAVALGRGYTWLDAGTYDSLLESASYIHTIEHRQGLMIGCIEEIAYRKGYINKSQLLTLADETGSEYGLYLRKIMERM